MKKGITILVLCMLCLCLAVPAVLVFGEIITDDAGMIEKARKEIPIADADTIELVIVGKVTDKDDVLVWFKSGNEYQNNRYTPIEFTLVGDDKYLFEKIYKPIDRGEKISVQYWKDNFVALIDNPNCTAIKICYDNGSEEVIPVDETPFVYSTLVFSGEYYFLDAEGNTLS